MISNETLAVLVGIAIAFMGWVVAAFMSVARRIHVLAEKISEMNGSVKVLREWREGHEKHHGRDDSEIQEVKEYAQETRRRMHDLVNKMHDFNIAEMWKKITKGEG